MLTTLPAFRLPTGRAGRRVASPFHQPGVSVPVSGSIFPSHVLLTGRPVTFRPAISDKQEGDSQVSGSRLRDLPFSTDPDFLGDNETVNVDDTRAGNKPTTQALGVFPDSSTNRTAGAFPVLGPTSDYSPRFEQQSSDARATGSSNGRDSARGAGWASELVDNNPLLRDALAGPLMLAVSSYWLSQAIYVAVKLRIPDVLASADRALTVREIAALAEAHPPTLYRLMRSLSGQGPIPGLFVEVFPPPSAEDLPFPLSQLPPLLPKMKELAPWPLSTAFPDEMPFKLPLGLWRSVDEEAGEFLEDSADLDRRYALTPLGAVFRENMKGGIRDVTLMSGQEMYQAWGALEDAVRTGGAAFDAAHGSGLWDFYALRPEAAATFDKSMSNLTTIHTAPGSAAATFDFSYGGKSGTVCDIGGGQGGLLAVILQRFPEMSGVLFDQEAVVNTVAAGGVLTDLKLYNATDASASRVALVPGSFFDASSIPKGCDVYVMKHIIHDWDDGQSVAILRNVADVMHAGSHLVLLEVVVPEDNSYNPFKTEFSSYFDLHMLVAVGGAERRPSEFKRIMQRAGLELVKIHKGRGPGALMCVIEAKLSRSN